MSEAELQKMDFAYGQLACSTNHKVFRHVFLGWAKEHGWTEEEFEAWAKDKRWDI